MTRILQGQSGIREVQADFTHHRVAVVVDREQVDEQALFAALTTGGYPAERVAE